MAQTPITESPSGKNFTGRFIWHDLLTPDPIAAGQFYEKLFGWQIDYQEQYAVVRNNGKLIAGILQVEAEDKKKDGVWIPSVSVRDVDSAITLVEANGGKVLKGPVDMNNRGRAVLISDPQRADLVLLAARDGDPVEEDVAIGDWLWDEIWTRTPDKAREFYSTVLGYDEVASLVGYDVFIKGGKWLAGIRHVDSGVTYLLWLPVVRVADPRQTAQRVEELGGMVWITPDQAPGSGETALISDTTGALLLIQRWPSQSAKGNI
ncbi:MAG: VOC family protein [Thermodesulfobacteriota bacterium]